MGVFDQLRQDLRDGLRTMRKHPSASLVAMLSLALGIGANTAVFSVINALILRPLPVAAPQQLVEVVRLSPQEVALDFPYRVYEHLRQQNQTLDDLFAFYRVYLRLKDEASSEAVHGVLVSGNYHSALRVRPALGRLLVDEDDQAGGGAHGAVCVISHRFWERRFGRAPEIVGRRLLLNGIQVLVVGVTEAGFEGVEAGSPTDLWVPLALEPQIAGGRSLLNNLNSWWLQLMGRLNPEVSPEAVASQLTAAFQQFRLEYPGERLTPEVRQEIRQETILLRDARRGLSTQRVRLTTPLILLATTTGLLLLIACANIANLLIARASARRQEIAVRLALGAGQKRLLRQMLAESFLIAGSGTMLALLLARWCNAAVADRLASNAILLDISLSWPVLGFACAIGLLTTLFFGILPAWNAARASLVGGLKAISSTRRPGDSLPLRRILVIVQVAMSVVLLLTASLMIRSLQLLVDRELGFSPDNVLVFRLDPSEGGFTEFKHQAFMQQSMDRIRALPGVFSASYSRFTPLTPPTWARGGFRVQGRSSVEEYPEGVEQQGVGPGFFKTLSMEILAGRSIDDRDRYLAPRVAVANQRLTRIFGLENPVGVTLSAPPFEPLDSCEIVGVARDARYHSLREETPPVLYLPYYQMSRRYWGELTVIVRLAGDPAGLLPSIRQEINDLSSLVSITGVTTMREHVAESLQRERFISVLTSALSLVALLLAAVGLGGVVSYIARRKTREIGIRMALGAARSDIRHLILGEMIPLVTIGGLFGLGATWAITRFISSLLFGVTVADPLSLALTAAGLATVAITAGYLPVRRASRADPKLALRYE